MPEKPLFPIHSKDVTHDQEDTEAKKKKTTPAPLSPD